MPTTYVRRRSWSDQFVPALKAKVGELFIGEASLKEDQEQATDMKTFVVQPVTVACRMRDHAKYFAKYSHEFTIRYSVFRNGNEYPTEFDKLMDGWGDYLIYAWGVDGESRLIEWICVNLSEFRSQWMRRPKSALKFGFPPDNGDGTRLMAVDIRSLWPSVIHSVSDGLKEYVRQ